MSRASALVIKLRANPKVRDAEALAAWIGRRKGGLARGKGGGGGSSGGSSGTNGSTGGASSGGDKKRNVIGGGAPVVEDDDPFAEDDGAEPETPEERRQRKYEERLLKEMEKADRAKLYSAIRDTGGIDPTPGLKEEYKTIPDAYGGGGKGLPGDAMAEYLNTYFPELGIETERDLLDYFSDKFRFKKR